MGASSRAPAVETLEGTDDPDPRLRLLEQFSELTPDALRLEDNGDERRLKLAPDQPPLNEPITMFFSQRVARSIELTASHPEHCELIHHAPVLPSDINVFDTLIHRDLFRSCDPPLFTVERFGFNPALQSSRPHDDAFRVEGPMEPKRLGTGISRSTLRAVPQIPALLSAVFSRIGHDPAEFRMYRCSLEHVPPGFAVIVWLPLGNGLMAR